MIKIVLLEDEIPARKKLKRFLEGIDAPIQLAAELATVADGIAFLKSNPVDLIFSDIELLDGNSFEIFNEVSLTCPIIFTTAYDQFWLDAFESNGIAYLLKPFSKDRFQKAWDKFLLFRNTPNNDADRLLNSLSKIVELKVAQKSFKKRFAVQQQQGIYFLDTENICFFEATDGLIFAHDTSGKKHLLKESTLKAIEEQLNPEAFFKLNRSELVQKNHIEKIAYYTKNALAVKLKGCQRMLISSQSSTALFRSWVEK